MKALLVAALLAFAAPAIAATAAPKSPGVRGVIVVEMDNAAQAFLFVFADGSVVEYSAVECASTPVCIKAATVLANQNKVLVLNVLSSSKT